MTDLSNNSDPKKDGYKGNGAPVRKARRCVNAIGDEANGAGIPTDKNSKSAAGNPPLGPLVENIHQEATC